MAVKYRKIVMVLALLLCASCASTHKTVNDEVREERVTAVDSVVARSEAHQLLAESAECENLHIVIEEYAPDATDEQNETLSHAPSNHLARRITISRERQRDTTTRTAATTYDSTSVQSTDSTLHTTSTTIDSDLILNQPEQPCWLFYALVVIAIPLTLKYAFKR